ESVSIAVPAFHGLEPKISVGYNSSGGNSYVGVGGSLDGFHMIERVSPGVGKGAPTYTSADSFVLNGELLLPCPTSDPSASCSNGGTHTLSIESQQKIVRDTAADKWYVWSKDGTKTTYAGIFSVGVGSPATWYNWRYGVQSVVDTRGNTVTYNWGAYGNPA